MQISRRSFARGVAAAAALSSDAGMMRSSYASGTDWNENYAQTGFYPPVTYLLIDDLFVARKEGVRRVLGMLNKAPEPILKPDKPWESGGHMWFQNGFLYDNYEKVWKLWYYAHDPGFKKQYPDLLWEWRYAYAVSSDGRNWEKPQLGVLDWNGSRRNNLVSLPVPTGGDGPLGNVIKDVREPDPKRRYKGMGMERHLRRPGEKFITWPGGPQDSPLGSGVFLYDSPDGFTWTRRSDCLIGSGVVMDGVVVHGFDEDRDAWILWLRARSNPKYRTIGVSFVRNLGQIGFPELVLAPDEEDPPGLQFDRMTSIKVPGGYVGLLRALIEPKTAEKIEVQLAFSRDARVWSRPAGREAFLKCGDKGHWDDRAVMQSNPVQVGDDIYILYSANTVVEGSARIGLATLKRDRWAGVEPLARTGVLQTRPVYFANRILRVNADARLGSMAAELMDPYGKPITGFTLRDCDRFSGDALEHTISWRGKKELPEDLTGSTYREGFQQGSGRVMSIRFHLDRAKLYSFSC